MKHATTPGFWQLYNALPSDIQQLADKNYALLQANPYHTSLQLKEIGNVWSVRIGRHYRALAYQQGNDLYWFWIGSHANYDKLMP